MEPVPRARTHISNVISGPMLSRVRWFTVMTVLGVHRNASDVGGPASRPASTGGASGRAASRRGA